MGGDWDCGEEVVRIWAEIVEDGSGVEAQAFDEEGDSTCAAGVLELVEILHAAGSVCVKHARVGSISDISESQ